jgi:hypothetical protein
VLRHVVCLTWDETASPDARQAVEAALAELPSAIPEIRDYRFGPDLGLAPGNADLAVVADFDDVDGWRRYQEHPAHQAVLAQRIRPILTARAAVQFELP